MKQRDYKREYATALERGDNKRFKSVGTRFSMEEYEKVQDMIERYNCKTLGDFIRKCLYDDILK